MASNPFKLSSKLPKDEYASPRSQAVPALAPIPSITRPERPVEPEMRRERFKRLAGMLKRPQI